MRARVTTALAAAAVVSGSLMAAAPGASAAPAPAATQLCKPNARTFSWSGVATAWAVTHASKIKVPEAPAVRNVKAHRVATVRTVIGSSGTRIPAQKVLDSLSAKVGYRLTPGTTPATAVPVVVKAARPGAYVAYAGVKKAKGSFVYWACNSKGTGSHTIAKGAVFSSWGRLSKGSVPCRAAVVPETLAAKALKYC